MKCKTEEERKQAKREYNRQWREKNSDYDKQYYQANREKRVEQKKQYYQANREKILEQQKQYKQANKEKRAEYNKQWYEANKEKVLEHNKQYYQANKEKWTEYMKQYKEKRAEYDRQRSQTPMGRASYLVKNYKQKDKKANRGECTLTAKWVVENIFTKPCTHCGKSGWQVIGCNRLDNSRPHTEDNVEPCCKDCNDELATEEKTKQVYQYTKEGELVKIWESTMECGRNGYSHQHISACCRGERKTHKGYIWSYRQ